jgi:hypothetical protein
MKCAFCELPLACQVCGKPYQPRSAAAHTAAYQPDMEVCCPECQAVLACRACGYVYGEVDDEGEPGA